MSNRTHGRDVRDRHPRHHFWQRRDDSPDARGAAERAKAERTPTRLMGKGAEDREAPIDTADSGFTGSSGEDTGRHRADTEPDISAERPGPAAGSTAAADRDTAAHGEAFDRKSVVAREREQFGGIKIGSAFFGWVTAMGMTVLLTTLVAGIASAIGASTNTDPNEAIQQVTQDPTGAGIIGAIVILAILLIAYYCGGYVAGRMARFQGARQGVAVWLWAIVAGVVLTILGAVIGSQIDLGANIPVSPEMTTAGIIAVAVAALVALAGAVLGGLAGMRFHRRVDRAGFDGGSVDDGNRETAR
jgi:hypothetical protein